MNQLIIALTAVLALISAGPAGSMTHSSVHRAHAGTPTGLSPMDGFPPTGLRSMDIFPPTGL